MTHLDAGLCIVRDWRPADKPSLVRSANNRNVWRNLTDQFPHPYTEAHADFWLAQIAAKGEPTHWAIEVDGEAVGAIGVDPGEGIYARNAHFGYWIAEPLWGRGIMSAAVRLCVDHVFASLPLVRLEAPVFAWNPASMRVLEKCGFVREGLLRKAAFKDGRLIDIALYARVR